MAKNLTTGLQRGLRQSIAGGLGTGDLFSTASLDLQFARHKSLDPRVTHTRQSSATYVDGDGVIKTATTNLLLRSEDFSTTWTGTRLLAFGSGSVANAIAAPNGTLTADKIVEDTATGGHYVNQLVTVSSGVTYSASCYMKAAERSLVYLALATTPSAIAYFDLSNGTVADSSDPDLLSAIITPVGDGWYRCSITTVSTGTSTNIRIGLTPSITAGTFPSHTGDGTSGIYIWGAQLEESSTVGQYVKTTTAINSAPRFDHDPETGESLGLLVEESRTNLLTYSEDLSGYTKNSITTPLDSSVINPTGSTGSYKILADSGLSGGDPGGIRINQSASSANSIVVSAFVKKSTYRYVYIGFGGLGNSFAALFDIEPGLTSNRLLGQGGNGTYTNIDAGYQNFSNDWIRIWAVGTTSGTNGPTVGMSPDSTTFAITNWTAAGTEEIYAWGLQYEDNVSFPTSYIPTEGSTVTRAADVASITGTNFSSWYNDSEGTVFSDFVVNGDNGSNQFIYDIAEGSAIAEEIFAFKGTSTDDTTHTVRSNSNIEANIASDNQSNFNAQIKSAFAVSATSTIAAVNLSLGTLAESVTMPTVDNLRIGQRSNSTFQGNFSLSRFTYWPTRLSNDTLQTITT